MQLGAKERENLEGKLVFWLREQRHAELFKDPAKLPESSLQELNLVANCMECRGTGKLMGDERCRYCEGRGTVWVIVARKA
jgi:RecJ-like exonuclease